MSQEYRPVVLVLGALSYVVLRIFRDSAFRTQAVRVWPISIHLARAARSSGHLFALS